MTNAYVFRLGLAVMTATGCYSAQCDCLPGPNTPLPDLAGSYSTQVTLGQNACGNVVVENAATVVTHNRQSNVITLTQSGVTWQGAVSTVDTNFTTAQAIVDIPGQRYVSSLAGRFTVTGFTATATVDRTAIASGQTCRYATQWIATRS